MLAEQEIISSHVEVCNDFRDLRKEGLPYGSVLPPGVSPVMSFHAARISGQLDPSSFILTSMRSAASAASKFAGMGRPGVAGMPDALRLRGV